MDAKKFWTNWLQIATILLILFGVATAFFNQSAFFTKINEGIIRSFPGTLNTGIDAESRKWLISIIGTMLIGWGINLYTLVSIPLKRGEFWAWRSLFYSLLIWFILDCAVSLYFGAKFNLFVNSFILLQLLGPLLFLRPMITHNLKRYEAF